MRFKDRRTSLKQNKWRRAFALVPTYCDDVRETVWMEYVYYSVDEGAVGANVVHRTELPEGATLV